MRRCARSGDAKTTSAAAICRPLVLHRAEIGLDDAGKVLVWDHVIVSQSIMTGMPFVVEASVEDNGIRPMLHKATAGGALQSGREPA